jgi:hypothetical protein
MGRSFLNHLIFSYIEGTLCHVEVVPILFVHISAMAVTFDAKAVVGTVDA